MHDRWEKLERVVMLLGIIVLILDLFYWRGGNKKIGQPYFVVN